jgi:transaldolase
MVDRERATRRDPGGKERSVNPLHELRRAGQSTWLDFLQRGLVTGGELERMVRRDAVSGVTSNPTIFSRAIGGSDDYDEAVEALAAEGIRDPLPVFYALALTDVRLAADVLLRVHHATGGGDGFVSFELEPRLARDASGSVAAAKDLFSRLAKPNVMIKVPGTPEGAPAVEELTAAGVNVNVTLLFSVETYEQVAMSYLRGLERRLEAGEPIDEVSSVASFFVSRVDSAVDPLLPPGSPLRGRVAVANAKLAYERFGRIFSGARWERLAQAGARVQRPLWASTGTKDPAYSDVLYVEELVGPDTVNTMPQATMDAFRDHGRVRPGAVSEGIDEARRTALAIAEMGVDLDAVTSRLLEDGIRAFEADLQKLLGVIGDKVERVAAPSRGRSRPRQPDGVGAFVQSG